MKQNLLIKVNKNWKTITTTKKTFLAQGFHPRAWGGASVPVPGPAPGPSVPKWTLHGRPNWESKLLTRMWHIIYFKKMEFELVNLDTDKSRRDNNDNGSMTAVRVSSEDTKRDKQ